MREEGGTSEDERRRCHDKRRWDNQPGQTRGEQDTDTQGVGEQESAEEEEGEGELLSTDTKGAV